MAQGGISLLTSTHSEAFCGFLHVKSPEEGDKSQSVTGCCCGVVISPHPPGATPQPQLTWCWGQGRPVTDLSLGMEDTEGPLAGNPAGDGVSSRWPPSSSTRLLISRPRGPGDTSAPSVGAADGWWGGDGESSSCPPGLAGGVPALLLTAPKPRAAAGGESNLETASACEGRGSLGEKLPDPKPAGTWSGWERAGVGNFLISRGEIPISFACWRLAFPRWG